MVLVDKDIKARVEQGQLIVQGFDIRNLGAVSYDLTMDCVCTGKGETSWQLKPGETVFVKSQEQLLIPHDLLGGLRKRTAA